MASFFCPLFRPPLDCHAVFSFCYLVRKVFLGEWQSSMFGALGRLTYPYPLSKHDVNTSVESRGQHPCWPRV